MSFSFILLSSLILIYAFGGKHDWSSSPISLDSFKLNLIFYLYLLNPDRLFNSFLRLPCFKHTTFLLLLYLSQPIPPEYLPSIFVLLPPCPFLKLLHPSIPLIFAHTSFLLSLCHKTSKLSCQRLCISPS